MKEQKYATSKNNNNLLREMEDKQSIKLILLGTILTFCLSLIMALLFSIQNPIQIILILILILTTGY